MLFKRNSGRHQEMKHGRLNIDCWWSGGQTPTLYSTPTYALAPARTSAEELTGRIGVFSSWTQDNKHFNHPHKVLLLDWYWDKNSYFLPAKTCQACKTKLLHTFITCIFFHSVIPTGVGAVQFPATNHFLVMAAGTTCRTPQHFCTSLWVSSEPSSIVCLSDISAKQSTC